MIDKDTLLYETENGLNELFKQALEMDEYSMFDLRSDTIKSTVNAFIMGIKSKYKEAELIQKLQTPESALNLFIDFMEKQGSG